MERKEFKDLNVIDNFMFNELATGQTLEDSKRFFTIALETILQKKIKNLDIIPQKYVQGVTNGHHGVIFDAYVEAVMDESGNEYLNVEIEPEIYDVEPNTYESDSEEKRLRYYHALIDTKILKAGVKYQEMKNVTVIMISNYDPFGKNLMWYTIKNHCVEVPDMTYEDGLRTIYLYTRGEKNIPSQKLADMLKFMENSIEENVVNDELKDLSKMMDSIKKDSERGIRYMKSWEIEDCAYRKGKAEMQAVVEQQNKMLAEKDEALAEKDEALAEKDEALAEKNEALAQKDRALAEEKAEIARLKALLNQK